MKLTDIEESIVSYLKEPRMLNKEEVEIVNSCFKLLSDDINGLINDVQLEQNTNKFNEVLNCILMISQKVLEAPVDDEYGQFSIALAELIYNWNANVQHDEVLRQLCLYVSRTSEMRSNMIDTTKILKSVDERMRDLSSWSPPSYEIAKEYFEALLEENDKEKEQV